MFDSSTLSCTNARAVCSTEIIQYTVGFVDSVEAVPIQLYREDFRRHFLRTAFWVTYYLEWSCTVMKGALQGTSFKRLVMETSGGKPVWTAISIACTLPRMESHFCFNLYKPSPNWRATETQEKKISLYSRNCAARAQLHVLLPAVQTSSSPRWSITMLSEYEISSLRAQFNSRQNTPHRRVQRDISRRSIILPFPRDKPGSKWNLSFPFFYSRFISSSNSRFQSFFHFVSRVHSNKIGRVCLAFGSIPY